MVARSVQALCLNAGKEHSKFCGFDVVCPIRDVSCQVKGWQGCSKVGLLKMSKYRY